MSQVGGSQRGRSSAATGSAILKSKLRPLTDPEEGLVVRSRLHQLMSDAVTCPLTHVVAPAGSGKTSLLATWFVTLTTPRVWLSVDEEDRDAMRFWSGMLVRWRRWRQ